MGLIPHLKLVRTLEAVTIDFSSDSTSLKESQFIVAAVRLRLPLIIPGFTPVKNADDDIIIADERNEYFSLSISEIMKFLKTVPDSENILIDVKRIIIIDDMKSSEVQWWRL